MKTIYSMLSVLLLSAIGTLSATAQKLQFTLNIDNPEAVTVSVNYETQTVVAGDNLFEVDNYTSIQVTPVPPYAIKSITNAATNIPESIYGSTWYYTVQESCKYNVVTYNKDELRTASCTVNVDDASRVEVRYQGTYDMVTLQNGENTVKFNPETEYGLIISPASYNMPLYGVTLNGTPVAAQGSSYNVDITQDCVVDITAIIPEKDVVVTFNCNEEGKGAISGVAVNYEQVSDFNGSELAMKAGQSLSVYFDNNYMVESFSVNGEKVDIYGEYNTVVVDNMTFDLVAHPYGTVKGVVTVDDPTNIIMYKGYAYNNDVIELVAGDNTVEVSENNTLISWESVDGSYIESVTHNGTTLDSYTTQVYLAEGDKLVFKTAKIEMDKKAVLWIDNREAAVQYFGFEGYDRTGFENLISGYNVIDFYSGMTPFRLSWFDPSITQGEGKVYINGVKVEPAYSGTDNYELPIQDGDIVKVFLTTEPKECNVTFTTGFSENVNVTATVVRDQITVLDDPTVAQTVFAGTEYKVEFTNGATAQVDVKVSVNDQPVAADTDGNYVFTVNEAQNNVKIEAYVSAVADIIVDDELLDSPVYNLQGIEVGKANNISNLPAGIYIVNGQKLIVR